MACVNVDTTDYCPGTINVNCIYEGFSYPDEWLFTDVNGDAIDITNDDFSLQIRDDSGTLIQTMGIGTGLSINGPNGLQLLWGAPMTDAAGVYSFRLIWSESATGASYPVVIGRIAVKA